MNRNVTLTRIVENNDAPNRRCEKEIVMSDIIQITKLKCVLKEFVAKPIAALIVNYAFEDRYQRLVARVLDSECLTQEARVVLSEYAGVSWVAELVTGYIPRNMSLGVNVKPAMREMLRYNTTEYGCTYGQFFELLIVRVDRYSNTLFLDYRPKHDETSGVIHRYRKPEISIPLANFDDESFSGVDGFCACGGYHTL